MLDSNTISALSIDNALSQDTSEGFELSNIPDYLTATGFDLGVSLWNTFAPDDYDTTTSDALQDWGFFDAERFYQDNKFGVELGSLVGGGLLTGFGAGAVINALRVGKMASLAYNPFGRAAQAAARNKKAALRALSKGPHHTAEYKRAMRGFLGAEVAGGAAAGIAQEAAFLGLMQEHAWMEDYGVGTFILGAGLYNLGLPIKYAVEKKRLISLGGDLQQHQFKGLDPADVTFTEGFAGVDDTMDILAHRVSRIQRETKALEETKPLHGFRKGFLEDQILSDTNKAYQELGSLMKGKLVEDTSKFLSNKSKPLLTAEEISGRVEAPAIQELYHFLSSNPTIASLQGVKSLENFTAGARIGPRVANRAGEDLGEKGIESASKAAWNKVISAGAIPGSQPLPIDQTIRQAGAVFDPWSRKIISTEESLYALRAGDVVDEIKPITKLSRPDPNKAARFFAGGTHSADSQYLRNLSGINSVVTQLEKQAKRPIVHDQDLPLLDALIFSDKLQGDVLVRPSDTNMAVKLWGKEQLKSHVQQLKTAKVSELDKAGFYDEQIALYLNMPVESVVAVKLGQTPNSFWTHTVASPEYAKAAVGKKKILLSGDETASSNALQGNSAKILDAEELRNIQGVRAAQAAAHPSTPPEIFDIYERSLQATQWKELTTHLSDFVSRVGLGSRFISSADFALRDLGPLGEFVSSAGTAIKNSTDTLIGKYVKPIAPMIESIRKDKSQSVLWEQFLNRYHEHGRAATQTLRYDTSTGKMVLREADDTSSEVLMKWEDGRDLLIDPNSTVGKFISHWQDNHNPLLSGARDFSRRISDPLADSSKGLYFPYMPIQDDLVGYIFNRADPSKTRIYTAKTPEDFAQLTEVAKKSAKGDESVVTRADANEFALIHGYAKEGQWLQNANPELQKAGIGRVNVSASADSLIDLMDSFAGDIQNYVRAATRKTHSQLFDQLDGISKTYRDELTSGNRSASKTAPLDYGTVISRTLLNQSLQKKDFFPNHANANSWFEVQLNRGLNSIHRIANQLKGKDSISTAEFTKIADDMARAGAPNPYPTIADYLTHNIPQFRDLSNDVIAQSSSLMAALNLRIAEAAHAAVTVLTLPVVTSSVLTNEKAAIPFKHLYNGMKMMLPSARNDPFISRVRQRGEEFGFTQMRIVEMMDAFSAMHQNNKVDKVLNTRLMKFLTAPSDWAEHFSRQLSYYSGISLALERDPLMRQRLLSSNALDAGESFANYFTQRTMGNYTSTQRPVMFQGQLGHALSLYQTFMLTMAQNMFKFMEERDSKAMLKFLAAQTGMFGSTSLPGSEFISKQIGEHLFEDNQDIKSTAYRLLGDTSVAGVNMAELILYGAPSAIFNQGFSSRAALEPRLPFQAGPEGIGALPPVVSMFVQTAKLGTDAVEKIAGTIQGDGSAMDYFRALRQAVSMQSLSRPLKGIAELTQGYTVDSKGEVIADNSLEELSNLSRAVGVRPLKEHVLRNTRYTNRYYDAVDYSNRKRAIASVRRLMAGPSDMSLSAIMGEYLENGGSVTGWNSIVNRAYKEANIPMATRLKAEIANNPILDYIVDSYTL